MDNFICVDQTVGLHTFKEKILDKDVFFQVIQLTDSFYLWIGKSNKFGDLSVAMATVGKTTSATNLIGGIESHSVALAEKLCKKTGKQVFIGGDLQSFDQLQLPLVEKRIVEEMKANPNKF